jgi:hypothetical protein
MKDKLSYSLDYDEALPVWVFSSYLLHLGCRPTYEMRSYLHARFKGIVRKPCEGEYKDRPIFKVCPSSWVFEFATGVEGAQVYSVTLRSGQAKRRHSPPWRDTVEPSQIDIVTVCAAKGHGLLT